MSLNSVNTNIGAQVALSSLNHTNTELQASQKRISTGFRVADATDDGGAYAIAQRVRSDVGALTSANEQLGNAKGLVGTALKALGTISDSVIKAKEILVKIGDSSLPQDQRDQYISSYKLLVSQVADIVDHSTYNGQSLLGKVNGAVAGTSKTVISSESGDALTISAADSKDIANTLAALIGSTFSRSSTGDTFGTVASTAAQTAAASALSGTAFSVAQKGVADQLNQTGADSNRLDATISFNGAKIDSLNAGLGALIDTDLSKESAKLQALQIKQQLGTQALSLANQAPSSLVSLFKG